MGAHSSAESLMAGKMIVYINGIAYTACESRWWTKRCCAPAGHDGRHYSGRWYWAESEAQA